VHIHRIPAVPFVREVAVGPSLIKPLLDVLLFFTAVLQLLGRRYAVIHSHEEAAFLAVFLAFVFRTRHIYDMHSSLPRQLANFGFGNHRLLVRVFERLERMVIDTCDAVLTVGTDLEAIVRAINPHTRVVTIENLPVVLKDMEGAEGSVAALKHALDLDGRRPIVYTGTFEIYQGMDLLLHSARLVVDANSKACFVVVGGKPHQVAHWQEEAFKLGLADSMRFVGTVPVEESVLYLDLADVLVSPRTGGTSVPLKIYSYLHAGKPIVATRLVAHTTVLTDEVACLVEPTKEAVAEGILALLDDPHMCTRLGNEAQAYAEEKYSFAAYKEKMRYIYQAQVRPTAARVDSSPVDSSAVVND
jgi:glycosyltransferase involved in cell wall biosynthesis